MAALERPGAPKEGGLKGKPEAPTDSEREPKGWSGADALDPLARSLSPTWPIEAKGLVAAASSPAAAAPDVPVASSARVSLEQLLPRLVRRVAWSGDARAGTVRLELGAGHLAGATLTIHAEGNGVRVHLELPQGADPVEWKNRIGNRLGAKGLRIDEIEVH